jgi:hypothetical protein
VRQGRGKRRNKRKGKIKAGEGEDVKYWRRKKGHKQEN